MEFKNWLAQFRRNRTSKNDASSSGRPQVNQPENIAKTLEIVLGVGKMKLSELINIIGISKKCTGHIICEFLPRILNIDQKGKRVRFSKDL